MIAGYVLAGGASRRMGEDKALMQVGGAPLAARVAAALAAGGCAPVTLVGRQPALGALGLRWLREEARADRHPLWGVAAALADAPTPLALIAATDLVNLDPSTIAALLAFGRPCVAAAEGHRHPLLALLSRAEAARAAALAAEGAPAHALTDPLPAVAVAAGALLDANRPEDLRAGPGDR